MMETANLATLVTLVCFILPMATVWAITMVTDKMNMSISTGTGIGLGFMSRWSVGAEV